MIWLAAKRVPNQSKPVRKRRQRHALTCCDQCVSLCNLRTSRATHPAVRVLRTGVGTCEDAGIPAFALRAQMPLWQPHVTLQCAMLLSANSISFATRCTRRHAEVYGITCLQHHSHTLLVHIAMLNPHLNMQRAAVRRFRTRHAQPQPQCKHRIRALAADTQSKPQQHDSCSCTPAALTAALAWRMQHKLRCATTPCCVTPVHSLVCAKTSR